MADPLIGRVLGGCRLERLLGRGGMAAVYLARDESLHRDVAVKVMLALQLADETLQERFRQEALATARLSHSNIVQVYRFDQQDDLTYMVMEYLPGGSLYDRIVGATGKGELLDQSFVLNVISQIALALDYAHENRIIHRDVKPANILFAKDGRPVLTDLGIARALEGPRLTKTRLVVGTPEYMSPEQGSGAAIDGRSDLYSLGIILFELLTGRLPFEAETPLAVIYKHVNEPLPPWLEQTPGISPALVSVVKKATAKHPEDRFQSGREMAEAIRRAQEMPAQRLQPTPPSLIATPAPRTLSPEIMVDEKTRTIAKAPNPSADAPHEGEKTVPELKTRPGESSRRRWIAAALAAIMPAVLGTGVVLALRLHVLPLPAVVTTPAMTTQETFVAPTSTPFAGTAPIQWSIGQPPTSTHLIPTAILPEVTATPSLFSTTQIPAATSEPTPTLLPLRTTIIPVTLTPAPSPTRVTLTRTPVPLVTSAYAWPEPKLVSPSPGASHSGRVTFAWSWSGPALQPNQAFEVRIWRDGQPDHYGAAEPVRTTSLVIDLNSAYGVRTGGSGSYYWTVALVQTNPYRRIGPEAAPRKLVVSVYPGDNTPPTWTPPPP